MESPTFETPEIYKNDQKQIDKILHEIYQYLYDLIKKDIKQKIYLIIIMSNIMSFIELLNRVTDSNILNDSFINQPVLNKPCSASFVDELEKVVITNEDVDNNLCCAICQSSFKLGEKVIKLPCKDPHFFHYEADEEECGGILPWLSNNNSCPVCVKNFT